MPYFKDTVGGLHFLDDAAYTHLLPTGCVAITDAQADAIQNPTITLAQKFTAFQNDVQTMLDTKARLRQYDSALSCVSYIGSANAAFNADGIAMKAWRDAVWYYAISAQTAVEANPSTVPTLAAFMTALQAACPAPW
jgi:hypothetical protein